MRPLIFILKSPSHKRNTNASSTSRRSSWTGPSQHTNRHQHCLLCLNNTHARLQWDLCPAIRNWWTVFRFWWAELKMLLSRVSQGPPTSSRTRTRTRSARSRAASLPRAASPCYADLRRLVARIACLIPHLNWFVCSMSSWAGGACARCRGIRRWVVSAAVSIDQKRRRCLKSSSRALRRWPSGPVGGRVASSTGTGRIWRRSPRPVRSARPAGTRGGLARGAVWARLQCCQRRLRKGNNTYVRVAVELMPSATLTLHSTKVCKEFKIFRNIIFFGTNKVTSEAFLSISRFLKVTRLQGCTQTKLWTCWQNFDHSRSFERFFFLGGSFMALLFSSRWYDQNVVKQNV